MLYLLEVENFFSIRDRQVLDLRISPNVEDNEGRFAPIFPGSGTRAPKVVALYGANASGKTTVLKALDYLLSFILADGSSGPSVLEKMVRFNDLDSMERPIRFAMEMGDFMNFFSDGSTPIYGTIRYELEIEVSKGRVTRVLKEALRQRPLGKGKWQRVFEREAEKNLKGSDSFKLSGYQHIENTLRHDLSVLGFFAFFGHPAAKRYTDAAGSAASNLRLFQKGVEDTSVIDFLATQPEMLETLNYNLNRIDLGIEKFFFDRSSGYPVASFKHANLQLDMPWALQSQGTQAFVRLFPILEVVLKHGGIALIDEFDTLIHPLMLPEILNWFHDKLGRNQKDAQVWLSCHSPTLMENLVKEEIVITEKDHMGRTSVFSLMDVKDVRRDNSLSKKYLSGMYGGVPVIG